MAMSTMNKEEEGARSTDEAPNSQPGGEKLREESKEDNNKTVGTKMAQDVGITDNAKIIKGTTEQIQNMINKGESEKMKKTQKKKMILRGRIANRKTRTQKEK